MAAPTRSASPASSRHGPGAGQARRGQGRRHRRVRPARQRQDRRHARRREGPSRRRSRRPPPPQPVFGLAIAAKEKKDEVKLTAAIAKIIEEDPSISLTHSQDMGEMVLWGQGEMHLRVALEKLVRKYGIDAVDQAAADPLQGNHPQIGRGARPSQEAVGRARPVRRRGGRPSSRDRAAPASSSPTRSPAAWCPRTTSRRSRSACATIFSSRPARLQCGRCRRSA